MASCDIEPTGCSSIVAEASGATWCDRAHDAMKASWPFDILFVSRESHTDS
jgi:hypothetical protein